MYQTKTKNSSPEVKNPESQAYVPLKLLLLRLFVELKAHRKLIKLAQQTLGCKVAKFRLNGKVSPREYINLLIKELTAQGIIEHWGEYEDTHNYRIAKEWVAWASSIELEAKRLAFEACSSLHSGYVDCIENLTLYSSYLLTLLNKRSKKDSPQGKSVRKTFFFETDPDLRLRSGKEEYDYLMEKYGVPFEPEYDNGLGNREAMKAFNAELFKQEECDCAWLLSL